MDIIRVTLEQIMTKRYFLALSGAITGFFLLGILGSWYYPHLNHWLQHTPAHAIILNADRACNPVGKLCTASDAALTMTLGLGDSVQPLTAFPVQVDLIGEGADKVKKVTVFFTMLNMNMGFNRFGLSQQADKTWRGQALLPVCSMGRRDWRVTVEVAGDKPYIAEYYLLTGS